MLKIFKKYYSYILMRVTLFLRKLKINEEFGSLKDANTIYNIGHTLYIKDLISLNCFVRTSQRCIAQGNPGNNDFVISKRIYKLIEETDELQKKIYNSKGKHYA